MTTISKHLSSVVLLALISGCATEKGIIPRPLVEHKDKESANRVKEIGAKDRSGTFVESTPTPPVAKSSTIKEVAPAAPVEKEKADINLVFTDLPLPTFIQAVYGSVLKKNFSVDPAVASRTDLVTVRTSQSQTPTQVENTVRMLLKSYGIAVTDVGGFVRIVPDNNMQGYAPEIRRGRALPETPMPLRPIFQLVELEAVRSSDVAGWIISMFGQKVHVTEDAIRNGVLLSGQSDDVAAAMEAIHVLDQPLMRGRESVRINPQFWTAEELARKLADILAAEGYNVGFNPGASFALVILPVKPVNAVLVFAGDKKIIEHTVNWAKELDRPSSQAGQGGGYFTYRAHYTDAAELAKTMGQLLGGAPAVAGAPPVRTGRVVVDNATNTLIFQGNSDEYAQILSLLQELDQPAKSSLIEVTVAEVKLTDTEQLGVEWQLAQGTVGGGLLQAGTLGGLGIATGGLTVKRLSMAGNPRLVLNALATANKAKILSSPRLMVKNGDTATIQVGDEVPVISSQQTSPTTGGTGSILQTVQYRNTGVILKVKPVIHAGDRIDIDVSQEVSSAATTTTGVSSSPTITSRKLETKLTLKDGATVLLGGLMQNNQTRNESGVPLLKDIPGVGQLFRTNTDQTVKTELMVLITPYIISDDDDAQAITDAFRRQIGPWAQYQTIPSKPVKKN